MRKTLGILLVLALVLSFSLVVTTPVAAQDTWYVVEGGAGSQDGTSWANAFATIGTAVTAASSGDTIEVAAGTYTEDVTIPPALTGLTLLGANAGKSAHPADPDGRGAESIIVGTVRIGISQGGSGVNFDGFRVESDPASGMIIRGLDIAIANTVVVGQDPYPTSGSAAGIKFERGGVTTGAPASFVFDNNWVEGYRYGILLDGPAADYDASGIPSLVIGNYLSNNQRAIQTMGSMHGGTIVHEISGNTIGENERGIRLAGGGFAIENNIIVDNDDVGIQAGSGTTAMDGLTIHYNCIINNGRMGVENVSGLEVTIDATLNWWGLASGPTHATNPGGTGDAVSDDVDFDPWLTGLAYTGDILFTQGDDVILEVTLSSSDNGAANALVDFYVDGDHEGSPDTDGSGVAQLNLGALPVGNYKLQAMAAGCMGVRQEIEVKAKEVVPPVGGTAYPVNLLTLVLPWLGLAAIVAGTTVLVLKRRQT